MRKLSNIKAELKKSDAYKRACNSVVVSKLSNHRFEWRLKVRIDKAYQIKVF